MHRALVGNQRYAGGGDGLGAFVGAAAEIIHIHQILAG